MKRFILPAVAAAAAVMAYALPAFAAERPDPAIIAVTPWHYGVREPGKLVVTVTGNTCIGDVQVDAVYEGPGRAELVQNVPTPAYGQAVNVVLRFPKGLTAGTWHLRYAWAYPCSGGPPMPLEWYSEKVTFKVYPAL